MADNVSQRSFSKQLHKGITAAQMREKASDAMRRAEEEESFPARVKISDPLDYEKELLNVKDEIKRFPNGKLLKLVLYPVDDISVESEIRLLRTERSTVPPGAYQQAENLFTQKCLALYTSHWHRLKYNYARYATGGNPLLNSTTRKDLQTLQFEIDEVEEEARKRAQDIAAQREKVQGKRGFLHKGPFPGEGSFGQKWRRRWCVLQHGTLDGNFYLEMYRDEKSVTPLKIVNLGTCEDVVKNPKTKQYGFDLLTGDDKLVYPLAADSEEDLEEWMEALSKALGIEDEAVAGVAQFGTWNRSDTLRDPHRTTLHSEHLKHTETTAKENAASRKEKRHRLFAVYPGLIGQKSDEGLDMEEAPVPGEHLGKRRILVKCKSLMLRLTARNSAGQLTHVEPFFVSLALYDASKGLKVSEDFHVDLNDFYLRSLLEKQNAKSLNSNNSSSTQQVGASGIEPKDQWPTLAQQVLFSVTFPHPDIYLVARIEKVLQSSISACAEPYIRMGDNTKVAQKLCKQTASLCSTLGEYRMPFAWAARPVFQPDGIIDTTSEFSPLYRQDRERLTDDDLLKVLSDYKNVGKMKLVTIPGTLDVTVQSYDEPRTGVLNPSLVMVRPFSSGGAAVAGENVIRESQEFVPVEAFHPHTNYYMHLTYTHHLYVYPVSLKYDAQRNFAKARNIVCCIQVKDKDDPTAQPLPVIYGTALGPAFQDRAFTTVLHHCTTPTFYREVKIELPVNIHKRHHILFTFHHVSCELQKASKKDSVATVVGYSWLPLLDKDGRLVTEAQTLPVAAGLRESYLACGPTRAGTSPHLPFVDGGKPLFRIDVRNNSTVYPKEKCLHQFFEMSSKLSSDERVATSVIEEAIEGMYSVGLPSLVAHLPVIFDQLLTLLVELSREQEAIKPQIMKLLLHYLRNLEEAKRTEVVQSYVQYMFETYVNKESQRTLHDELAKQLALYLKQQDSGSISLLLDHMWLFFEMILKSVAQYLKQVGKLDKLSSRKKCPYSEDLYWNLQTVIFNIHTCIRMKLEEGRRANKSVASFVRRCFTVMDRGQVFKMMAKYLETFRVRDNKLLFEMKTEFLRIVCDCEHFVPLNLPWAEVKDVTQCAMVLSEEYCERHFLLGVLLREMDSALQFEPVAQRRLAVKMLCSLVAKLDLDDRYTDPVQKAIISSLFLPLLSIALENVHRLNIGFAPYQASLSRSNKAESVYSSPTPQHTLVKRGSILSSFSPVQPGHTPEKEREMRDGNTSPQGTVNRFSMISVATATNRAASRRPGLLAISEVGSPQTIPTSASGSQLKESTASMMATGVSPNGTLMPNVTAADLALQEWDRLSPEETKDLLSCVVFVLKNSREDVLLNWWHKCLGSLSGIPPVIWEKYIYPEVLSFFDLLGCCLNAFNYRGRLSISAQAYSSSSTHVLQKMTSEQSLKSPVSASLVTSGGGGATKKRSEGTQKKNIVMVPESPEALDGGGQPVMTEERVQVLVSATANCAMEVSLVILDILELFGDSFREELEMEHGDNILMRKYFLLLMTFLRTNQSVEMLQHIFAFIRSYIHKFPDTLYKGSSEFCSLLCYEVLQCCNSRLPAVRSQAATVLYLILKKNWEFFKGQGLVRSHVQSTIAVSVLVSQIREKSDNNLRRSLFVISNFPAQPDIVRAPEFSREVSELMKRLRTVLTSSAQMKEYHNDPERLADLYYDLAQSYASSPELRKTWLSNLLQLHVNQGNFSEAAMCCLHMAGMVAEYLKLSGQHSAGCTAFGKISPNISKEESGIKQDIETGEEDQCYTKHDLVAELQNALDYLWEASRYEVMGEVGKLLLPFYEEERDYQLMSTMYKKLHLAYDKVVDVMATRRRYLATYYKVAFFGKSFKGDDGVQYVYKEPKVTPLAEFSMRLQTLYGKRIGHDSLVFIQSSTKVDVDKLDAEKAYIQITHVEPYFTPEEELERRTQFEHENNVSSFVYDTPFTKDGKVHGETTAQCMRKTVVTTENWFPFVKKRIRVIHEEAYELTPIQVGLMAIEHKSGQLAMEVGHSPPDLKKLQLLLQGSISAQVHSGAMEYANAFLTEDEVGRQPVKEVLLLKEAYREFMGVCKESLDLSKRLISSDQLPYQEDLEDKFVNMQSSLGPLIGDEATDGIGASMSRSPVRELSLTPQRWSVSSGNPHRLSSAVFNAISNSNVV